VFRRFLGKREGLPLSAMTPIQERRSTAALHNASEITRC
jgi:hypothetical protein